MNFRGAIVALFRLRSEIGEWGSYLFLGLSLLAILALIASRPLLSTSLARLNRGLRLYFFAEVAFITLFGLSFFIGTGQIPIFETMALLITALTTQIQVEIAAVTKLKNLALPRVKTQLIAMRHWLVILLGAALLIILNALGSTLLTALAKHLTSEVYKDIVLWLKAPIALYFCLIVMELLRTPLLKFQFLAVPISNHDSIYNEIQNISLKHHVQFKKLYEIRLDQFDFDFILGHKGNIFLSKKLRQKVTDTEFEFLILRSLLDRPLKLEQQRLIHYSLFSVALFLPYFLLGQTLDYLLPVLWAVSIWKLLYALLFTVQQILKRDVDVLQLNLKSSLAAKMSGISESELTRIYKKLNSLNGSGTESPVIFGLPSPPRFPTQEKSVAKMAIKVGGISLTTAARNAVAITIVLLLSSIAFLRPKYMLRMAASRGDINTVRRLLDEGLSADSVDVLSNVTPTPLLAAAESGNEDLIALLLSKGANPNKKVPVNFSPLVFAVMAGKIASVDKLVLHGANVNFRGVKGYSALMWAARLKQLEIVKYLVKNGALLDLKSDHHSTALMLALQMPNNEEIVRYLIDQGADVRLVDLDGDSAIDIAKRKHLQKEVQWLEARALQNPSRLPSSSP